MYCTPPWTPQFYWSPYLSILISGTFNLLATKST